MSAKSKVTTKRCFIMNFGYGPKLVLPFTKSSMDLLEQLDAMELHDCHYVNARGYVYYRARKPSLDVMEIEIFEDPDAESQLDAVINYFKAEPANDEPLAEAAQ